MQKVTPLAGVWIEILLPLHKLLIVWVTPLAGVWIEINIWDPLSNMLASLPSRECGLKFIIFGYIFHNCRVTPLAGVWIEILDWASIEESVLRHSPRGSVD